MPDFLNPTAKQKGTMIKAEHTVPAHGVDQTERNKKGVNEAFLRKAKDGPPRDAGGEDLGKSGTGGKLTAKDRLISGNKNPPRDYQFVDCSK